MARKIFLWPMLWLWSLALSLSSCVSVRDAGKIYFNEGNKVKGVEPAQAYLDRMKTEKTLRVTMYGQAKAEHIIRCTLLRNQLYVASMKNAGNKEMQDLAKLFEEAYQQNDEAFLEACDHISGTTIGKDFLLWQQEYLSGSPHTE